MRLKRLLMLLPATLLLAVPVFAQYTDVPDDAWYAQAVSYCREHALMNGTGNDRFSPELPVSRAAAVTTLWRLNGAEDCPPVQDFPDVPEDAWYAQAVSWAVHTGLVAVDGGCFGAGDSLNREQLAELLWRSAGRPETEGQDWTDAIEIHSSAADAVNWVCAAGVMAGTGENRFSPQSGVTRAQLAEVLMNLSEGTTMQQYDGKGFTEFDSALIAFLENTGYAKKNYMVSPTSFRAALALASAGADGDTKTQLMHAMGFETMDEVNAWYASVQKSVDSFAEQLRAAKDSYEQYKHLYSSDAGAPDRAFSIANSVWHNADLPGTMSPDYIKYVKEHYRATAEDVPAANLTDSVNRWVSRETNGLIPQIADDLAKVDAVLINALYLRTSWLSEFSKWATAPGDFTTVDGTVVQKDFMNQKDKFGYYEDADSKVLVMPMEGGIQAAFVLGDASGLSEKLEKTTREEVIVKLPKFELETSLSGGELIQFLKSRGAELPFSSLPGQPDFSLMSKDAEWYISDIIQKSKIKVDEDGIEAAAVTAVMMNATTALRPEPRQPREFIADKPFTFCLYTGSGDAAELLFFGVLNR